MTAVSILGTGRVGSNLGAALARAGHVVTFGARDHTATTVDVAGATTTTVAAAAAASSIVINATPGDSTLDRLSALRETLAGRVLVDVSNAATHEDGGPGGLVYPSSSVAEALQAALPETAVVKTLNTMLFTVMTDPDSLSAPASVFLSGNDAAAKSIVRGLLHDLGWTEAQILDLGDVRSARGPEAAFLLVPSIMRSRGLAPFAISVAD